MSQVIEKNTETTDEISKITHQYLLDNLDPEFYASDFSQEHFESLLTELISTFGEEKTQFRIKTIRTCILNHFTSLSQECEVTISQGKINIINILPEGVKTSQMNKALIGVSVLLNKLVKDKKTYSLQEHLLCYPQDTLQDLYQKFSSTPLEEKPSELRDIIRSCVKDDFNLHTRDIVLFLRKNLYVRYFVDLRNVQKENNRRFLGVSSEDLALIYEENFPEDFEDKILEMAPDVIKDALNFGRIDNFTFKETYIEVFRTLIDVAMAEYTSSLEKDTVLALNGYVLRLYFDRLLYLCAQTLIDMVMQRDRKADVFLRFYNGETMVEKGGKNIKKPFIVDVKKNIWNYSSIFSIMTQCTQYEKKYEQQLQSLNEAEESYKKSEELLYQSQENEKNISKELSLIKNEIQACTLVKNNLLSIKKPSKDERSALLKKKQEEKNLLARHDEAFTQRNDASLKLENARIVKQSRLKQFEAQKRSTGTLQKKGEELYAQQDNIFSAIAKALIFRE